MYLLRKLLLFTLCFCFCVSLKAQNVSIAGSISNSSNQELAGVNIVEKGTNNRTQSDFDGRFLIKVSDPKSVLVISHVGYEPQEVPLNGQIKISVILQFKNSELNDVVVIGYGVVKKKDLTGSVAQVKSEELNQFPTSNALQSLSGRAAGVRVIQNDGTPGAQPSIRIRGTTSILGSNEPLYVVDGLPGASISGLQSSDIASMEILKDASATAIYGSRGANGVVIVTTKKGTPGRTLVEYNGSYGIQSPAKRLNLMNNEQWAEFYNEQAVNDKIAPYFSDAQIDSIKNQPSIDWQKMVLRNAPITSHSVSVSGGNEKTQFSVSGNIFQQDGIIRNNDFKRYSIRANLTHKISNIFSVTYNSLLSMTVNQSKGTGVGSNRGGGLLGAMLMASPAISPYDDEGALRRINTEYPWLSNSLSNPLYILREQNNKTVDDQELANVALSITPINGMTIKLSGSIQNDDSRNNAFTQVDANMGSAGSASVSSSRSTNLLSENTINYTKRIGKHNFSVLGGFTYQDYTASNLSGSGIGFLSNIEESYDLAGAATPGIPSSGYNNSVLISYLGRFNYSYDDRYLVTFSYRQDGSSKFSTQHKWSGFPSGALAWVVSNEKFMHSLPYISNLKLRGSYGASGNNALNPYQTLNMLGSSKVVFGDALYTVYSPGTTKPGPLKWETTNEYDAGLDIGILNNRVNMTADYYYKKTTNLLNTVQLPPSSGYASTLENVGAIENHGWEFSADARIIDRQVKWSANANISFNRNKVLKLYGGQDIYGSAFFPGPFNDFVNLLREGQPVGIFYGYVDDGYTADGNIKYKDIHEDGVINSQDKTYIGNPNPRFTYGFNSDISYKGFSLSVFLQGSQGNDIFNLNAAQTIDLGFGLNEPVEVFNNHWTPNNTNAKYPKITKSLAGNVSSRFVENGSYLRFKNIQLGYDLPITKHVNWIKNIQVYVSAQNLFTITKYSWYDPEVNSYGSGNSLNIGIDSYGYPTAKSFTFGVRCTF